MWPRILRYYSEHGLISNPKEHKDLLESLPSFTKDLCSVIQGIMVHPYMPPREMRPITKHRLEQMETRFVAEKLEILEKLQYGPLSVPREKKIRLVGCCRDYALLLCSALRQKKIPARVRYGFATYFGSNFFTDHVICEYWSEKKEKWVRVDAQIDKLHRSYYNIRFDPTDIPTSCFFSAGELWPRFRSRKVDQNNIGLDPNLNIRGVTFLSSSLVRDFASLNKVELLCMDAWGLADKESLSEEDSRFLDDLAELTTRANLDIRKIHNLFAKDRRLAIPRAGVKCYSSRGTRIDKIHMP